MIKKVFAIYDTKACYYGQPIFCETRGVAIRSFTQYINEPNGKDPIQKFPDDFILYEIGEFDDSKGTFTNSQTPAQLGHGTDFCNHEQ